MNTDPGQNNSDAELRNLVAGYLDQTLSAEQTSRLEERLKDPVAMDYFAGTVRFDATLQEAINPQSVEWEETRRIVFDPRKGEPTVSLQHHRRLRIGNARPRRRLPWILAGLLTAAILAASIWLMLRDRGGDFRIRNGDFESMNLDQSPSAVSQSILYWQESFSTDGALLCDLNRVTGGKLYAKSGRNVVSLTPQAFLNQVIVNEGGENFTAAPGQQVVVRGQYINQSSAGALELNLRFVASGYPQMIQYDAASTTVTLEPGGWHPFQAELILPENLTIPPTIMVGGIPETPPLVDLEGKAMTLSVDNSSPDGVLYLDDLVIEVVKR